MIEPLGRAAGGATEQKALGVWYKNDGTVQVESIQTFMIFCDLEKLGGLRVLEWTAQSLKELLSQESVAFELNGALYLS